MISPRQSEINKNKIVDWLKEDKMPFQELDVKQYPELSWNIVIGGVNIVAYTTKAHPDRVFIQTDISFLKEQQDLLNKQWSKEKLVKFQLQVVASLTSFNIHNEILLDKDENIRGIRIYSFLIDNLNKENFMNSQRRLEEVFIVILTQVSATMEIELQALKDQQRASSVNPLAT